MPKMDDGPTDGPPGEPLRQVSIELGLDEARDLLESLKEWSEEIAAARRDLGWHTHVDDDDGNELTISIR